MCAAKYPASGTSALRLRSVADNDRSVGLRRQRREREAERINSLEEIESLSSSPPQAKRVCGRQRRVHTQVSGVREALVEKDVDEASESVDESSTSRDRALRSPINQPVDADDMEEEVYTNYEEDAKTIMRPFRLLDDAILFNPAESPDLDFDSLLNSVKAAHTRLSSLEQKLPDLIIVRCRYTIPTHDGVWLHDEAMSEAQYEELKRCDWQYTLPTSAFGMYSSVFAWLDDFVYEVIRDVRLALFYLFTERIKPTRFLLEEHERFQGKEQAPVEVESTLSDDIEYVSSDASSYSLSEEDQRQPNNGDGIDEIESFESEFGDAVPEEQQRYMEDTIEDGDTRSNGTAHSMDTPLEDEISSNSSSSSTSSRSALV